MKHRVTVVILLAALAPTLGGCGFAINGNQGVSGWFDPYHESMAGVNEHYAYDPLVAVPTGLGNIVGVTAFLPLTLLTGAFGSPPDSSASYFEYAAAATAYAGGFLVGTPFLLLDFLLVRWWHDPEASSEARDTVTAIPEPTEPATNTEERSRPADSRQGVRPRPIRRTIRRADDDPDPDRP